MCYASIALIGENDTDRQGKKHKKRIRNDRRKIMMKPELERKKRSFSHFRREGDCKRAAG